MFATKLRECFYEYAWSVEILDGYGEGFKGKKYLIWHQCKLSGENKKMKDIED